MALWFFGIGGFIGSLFLVGLWHGVALLFGFPQPTPDQGLGLSLILGCSGVITGAVLTAVWS